MELEHSEMDIRKLAFGRPTIQTRTDLFPAGEKLAKGAANAIWDAWLIGLEQSGYNVQREMNQPDREPMEPEI
ncbi:MAG: hypothetical protein WBN22_06305 [Verrucomicrobiia bacterium]